MYVWSHLTEDYPALDLMSTDARVHHLRRAYALFNKRDVDRLLAMMTDDVEWPDVANDAVLHGKEAIRPYWEHQFEVANPRVEPIDFLQASEDLVAVVEQEVLDRHGAHLVPPAIVFHRYSFEGDLVRRMVVFKDASEATGA